MAQWDQQCLCSVDPAPLVKGLALPQLECRWKLGLGSDPWPGEPHMLQGGQKRKRKKKVQLETCKKHKGSEEKSQESR